MPDFKNSGLTDFSLRKCGPSLVRAAALLLVLVITSLAISQCFFASRARGAEAGVAVYTDSFLYHAGDSVTFNITLNSGSRSLSGELLLKVYPAASPASPNVTQGDPLKIVTINKNYSLSGRDTASFNSSLTRLGVKAGGYPVRVSLESGGQELLGATCWLAVAPAGGSRPLDLVLVWALSAPPGQNPAGEFADTSLLNRCRANPRPPDTLIENQDVQQKYPQVKTTYAIEPEMLDELAVMAGGFRVRSGNDVKFYAAGSAEAATAAGCLDSLRQAAAGGNEILASPYTYTDLSLLARNGWDDGSGQFRVGDDTLARRLNLAEVPKGAYAPGLDVTTDSLRYLAATGNEYTVLPGSLRAAVESPPGLENAVSYRVRDTGGERITALFAADDASNTLLGGQPDPAAFFASLANAYENGSQLVIAAATVPDPAITAEQRGQVYDIINKESWLSTLTLSGAVKKYPPSTEPATLLKYTDPVSGYVSKTYYQKLEAAHELFEDYRAAVDPDEATMIALTRKLFIAENAYWAGQGARPEDTNRGLPYLDDIVSTVKTEFGRLSVSVGVPLLQGSAGGEAQVAVSNANRYPISADIVVEGDNVQFPQGADRRLTLAPGRTDLKIPYRGSGWSRIRASVQSRGHVLADDSATIHPLSGRAWIVIGLAAAALLGGAAYYFLAIRRRT